jgi:hypothetical protein
MRIKKFMAKDGGQVFSIDMMFAFIIITVIIGVSANAMDMVSYRMQDYSSRFSLERVTTDAADILIKTPGSPENWDKCNYSYDMVPGLAQIDVKCGKTVPNTLSLSKVSKLGYEYRGLMNGKIFPPEVNSSMVIYPVNTALIPMVIWNDTLPVDASEIAVANRTVLCDFLSANVIIGTNTHGNPAYSVETGFDWEICPHVNLTGDLGHQQPISNGTGTPGWVCHHFNITFEDLQIYDFYILTDPEQLSDNSARWIIDRPENMTKEQQRFVNSPILINDRILQTLGTDTRAVLWFHIFTAGDPKKAFKAYIISVRKGTPLEQVDLDYLNPQPCFFVLKVWYN